MRTASRLLSWWLVLTLMGLSAGCVPRTVIVKDPRPRDRGVRYYRPKPYLLVRPMLAKDTGPVPGMVELSIEYLPDFSEEYSIHVRSGLGTNDTQIKLDQGWNLTALNIDVDSQTDENLRAASELVSSVMPALTAAGRGEGPRMVVPATNVPMGLYESVVSADRAGTKRLYGFRYVGFMPFAPCPVESGGVECHSCYDEQVYGLVFENGAMIFRPLLEIPEHKKTGFTSGTEVSDASRDFFLQHVAQLAAQHFSQATGLPVHQADAIDPEPQRIDVTLGLSAEVLKQYQKSVAGKSPATLANVAAAVQQQIDPRLSVRVAVAESVR